MRDPKDMSRDDLVAFAQTVQATIFRPHAGPWKPSRLMTTMVGILEDADLAPDYQHPETQ